MSSQIFPARWTEATRTVRRWLLPAALTTFGLLMGAAGSLARAQDTVIVAGENVSHGADRVTLEHNVDVPAGDHAHSAVAILGSASVEGDISGDVVAVAGNVNVTGPVRGNAVAVLGSVYVNSHVDGNAVAVLGSLELGPNAEVDGDVQAVGGQLRRDPGSIVHGDVSQVGADTPVNLGVFTPWVRHAALYLRPLAIGPGLGWAWAVAGTFLALYLLLAFVAPRGVARCVLSLELHPGPTLLAALATVLLTPPLLVLLVITVIGIAAIPVVVLALFCAALFGKAAALAWLGGRFLRHGPLGRSPAADPISLVLAVALGGVIVLAIYLVPLLGLIVYKLLGLLGLGMVVHALILAARERHAATHPGTTPLGGTPDAPGAAAPPGPYVTAMLIDPSLPRAGFWIRMAALLLDAIVVGIILHLLRWHHLILPVLAAYGAILWKARGATLGGIVFGLHVVRMDGQPLDWTTAIVRALGCFLSLAVVGLGFFWIAFDEYRQAWHDKFAGTLVVRVARAPAPLRA